MDIHMQQGLCSVIWFLMSVEYVICSSGCETIEIVNSYDFDGFYKRTSTKCSDRYVYQYIGGHYELYYINKYWVIHNIPCVDDGAKSGYARVRDPATYPEYIVMDWQTRVYGEWLYNVHMYTDCEDDDDEISEGALVGILLGCLFGSFVVVTILVGCVKAAMKRRNMQHNPDSHTSNSSSDPPMSYPSVVTSDFQSGFSNHGYGVSGLDYPGSEAVDMDLPSYEEAIRAHNKHYGTDISDRPPVYVECPERNIQRDNDPVAGNSASEIISQEENIYDEMVLHTDTNMSSTDTPPSDIVHRPERSAAPVDDPNGSTYDNTITTVNDTSF